MKRFAICVLCVLAFTGFKSFSEIPVSLHAGDTWVYKHEGPRPFSREEFVGERIRTILSIEGEGDSGTWIFKDMWGTYDERPWLFYVDCSGNARVHEMSNSNTIEYKNPIPIYLLDLLGAGEEKTVENTITIGNTPNVKYKIVLQRLPDETIAVPAGTFENCQHYQSTNEIIIPGGDSSNTIKFHLNSWYHSSVHGMVKEIFSFEPVVSNQNDGPTTICSLKKYIPASKE